MDAERFEDVYKSSDMILKIPALFGFDRRIFSDSNSVFYIYHNLVLKTFLQIYAILKKHNLELPTLCFTFEPAIDVGRRLIADETKERFLLADLSNGSERFCIPVILSIENSKPKPPRAVYTKGVVVSKFAQETLKDPEAVKKIKPTCCNCDDNCRNKLMCACFQKTLANCDEDWRLQYGDERIGYIFQRLLQPIESGLFECSSDCRCNRFTCFNRVSQNGMMFPLQLVHYDKKGWGVRASVDIPKGSFVCTYAGELVTKDYAETNFNDSVRSSYLASLKVRGAESETNVFVLDGYDVANIGPYLNHSCSPNCFPQHVFWNINDRRWPQVAFFANRNIFAGDEITWDYGYEEEDSKSPNKTNTMIKCHCGSEICKGFF